MSHRTKHTSHSGRHSPLVMHLALVTFNQSGQKRKNQVLTSAHSKAYSIGVLHPGDGVFVFAPARGHMQVAKKGRGMVGDVRQPEPLLQARRLMQAT